MQEQTKTDGIFEGPYDAKVHEVKIYEKWMSSGFFNPDNLPVVDHINRNRLDNRVENLRWSTREDNWYNFELSIEKCIHTLTRAGYTIIPPK